MDEEVKKLTRRDMLLSGVGLAGTFSALSPHFIPALAHARGDVHEKKATKKTSNTDEWKRVAEVFGTKGTIQPGDVLMIDLPRSDARWTVFGIEVKPELGFDTEISFQHISSEVIVKWEMVLLDEEVSPVMDALFNEQDLKPSATTLNALHNHFLEERPTAKFLHGTAIGDPIHIAKALRRALERSKTPFGRSNESGTTGLPDKHIEETLRGQGLVTDGVLSVSVDRKETFKELGVSLESAMQVQSLLNFQALGHGKAATVAEIIVLPGEADAVARTFRKSRLFRVTTLHNHELFLEPNAYYVHAWGVGDSIELAHVEQEALSHINRK